jgi:hypothetical protein
MPEVLAPERATFDVRDGEPLIILDVDPTGATGHWSLLSRPTMCVVDGPGDTGYLLVRLTPAGDAAPAGWDEAVAGAGGSHVVLGTAAGAPAVFARALA